MRTFGGLGLQSTTPAQQTWQGASEGWHSLATRPATRARRRARRPATRAANFSWAAATARTSAGPSQPKDLRAAEGLTPRPTAGLHLCDRASRHRRWRGRSARRGAARRAPAAVQSCARAAARAPAEQKARALMASASGRMDADGPGKSGAGGVTDQSPPPDFGVLTGGAARGKFLE